MRGIILKKFNDIGNKTEQDKYLGGLISVNSTKRKLTTEENPIYSRAFSNLYKVKIKVISLLTHNMCIR